MNRFVTINDAMNWLADALNVNTEEARQIYERTDCPRWNAPEFCEYDFLSDPKVAAPQQTTAQRISAMLGDDGEQFHAQDGRTLAQVCEAEGAKVYWKGQPRVSGSLRLFEFADGSGIVEQLDTAWDVRPEGCKQFCWDGVGCECE